MRRKLIAIVSLISTSCVQISGDTPCGPVDFLSVGTVVSAPKWTCITDHGMLSVEAATSDQVQIIKAVADAMAKAAAIAATK